MLSAHDTRRRQQTHGAAMQRMREALERLQRAHPSATDDVAAPAPAADALARGFWEVSAFARRDAVPPACGPVLHLQCSMLDCFGLRALYNALNVPYLQLKQRAEVRAARRVCGRRGWTWVAATLG